MEWKPIGGFPVTYGWINAIRRGHARLHKGLDVGVPSLVLRSARSGSAPEWTPEVDELDAVLDTRQIARWSGCLGDEVTAVPITAARHDVFLSNDEPRAEAYRVLDRWLHDHDLASRLGLLTQGEDRPQREPEQQQAADDVGDDVGLPPPHHVGGSGHGVVGEPDEPAA